ncbi:MAG: hypothetical protein ABTQ25_18795 [Nitrosomonas ureae]
MAKFSKLNNLYWQIRHYSRNKSAKRKYYRYAAVEKKRLVDSGVDKEELRLYCRVLSSRLNSHAQRNLDNYVKNRLVDFSSS